MRKGPLSKSDKTFIENNITMSVEDLAKKLDRSDNSVRSYYEQLKPQDKSTKTEIKNGNELDQFARNKKYGVVIMTENASMSSDSSRNKRVKDIEQIRKFRGAIHRIKD